VSLFTVGPVSAFFYCEADQNALTQAKQCAGLPGVLEVVR
jgi:hypothetical protein